MFAVTILQSTYIHTYTVLNTQCKQCSHHCALTPFLGYRFSLHCDKEVPSIIFCSSVVKYRLNKDRLCLKYKICKIHVKYPGY
jgi:hypothetical protein